jgi:hypothetical protein
MALPKLIPSASIRNPEVKALAEDARKFLANQSWCRSVDAVYLGWAIAGVVGVFLARHTPVRPGIDSALWIVVGDLPPAYLVHNGNPTWLEALQAYVAEMERWVSAVRSGEPL